jgi:23S rRNA pseudouridine2457 synthase
VHYILFHKPYGVLSQFTREAGHLSLRDYGPFPKGVYPVGRLDADSEGLVLLTDDNRVKHRLATPASGHEKTYLAQVERVPTAESLEMLARGVLVHGARTRSAKVRLLHSEPALPPRSVPIRFRKNVPTCWIELRLTEGRNRQVRRMTAAIGHPTLRLVRTRIGFLSLEGLEPGMNRALAPTERMRLLQTLGKAR